MNIPPLWQIPWRSTHRSLRWWAIVMFVLCSVGALGFGRFAAEPGEWSGAVALYGAGLFYLWAFFLPLSLLLAIDAEHLRLPGIQRRIGASLLLHGVLGLVMPLLVLGLVGLPLFQPAVLLLLLSAGGLTLALMPRYLVVLVALSTPLLFALWRHSNLPGFEDPRMSSGIMLLSLLLLLACTWRWRQLLRAGSNQSQGWSSAMLMQFRHGSWGHWNAIGDRQQLRQRPDWLQLAVNLDGIGPATPRKALRVALGGWYLPQTARSYARQFAVMLGIPAVSAACALALGRWNSADMDLAAVLGGSVIGLLGMLYFIAGPMICVFSLLWLGRRWQQTNAELPLLALLPGLGGPAQARRQLLRTGLALPLGLHALLLLPLGVAMLAWSGHAYALSFMLLAQLGAVAVTVAALLNVLGGRALSPWVIGPMLTVVSGGTVLSLILPALVQGYHLEPALISWLLSLMSVWLVLGVAAFWLGWRGWRAFVQRPHPFLAG